MAAPVGDTCAECGWQMPADTPGGLCPKCLLGVAMGREGEEPWEMPRLMR